MLLRTLLLAALLCASGPVVTADPDLPPGGMVMSLDLSKPFGLPPGWRVTAVQAPPVKYDGDLAPGRITLCIRRNSGPCVAALETSGKSDPKPEIAGFYFLDDARIVHPRGPHGPPLLLVRASSL